MTTQSTQQATDPTSLKRAPDPCLMVIFGATGDLTARKLMPALYNLTRDKQLPPQFGCVGFARREKSDTDFRKEAHEDVSQFSRSKPIDESLWNGFSERLFYHQSEFHEDEGYERLSALLDKLDEKLGTMGNRVFYLSTQPSFFPLIIEKLHQHKLIYDEAKEKTKWSRVIIEKPFGHNLASALELQKHISQYLSEGQIFRIDHYLGKETVQNLMVFRFTNAFFESEWNNRHIENVQITVAEDIGIGSRGRFWEEAGMLRDIVQNHMMQLLSLVAMEPPISLKADAIRDEKLKVMESIRQFPLDRLDEYVIRGQYAPGTVDEQVVKGYREEENVPENSNVETFVALRMYVDNWRWAGVPFFLRAGKRLAKRTTEIMITFKEAPCYLFDTSCKKLAHNVLVIRIQPDEGISLKMNCKVPGVVTQIQPVQMDFRYGSYFGATPPEAYERLICDCMSGDSTLFARADEVIASWRIFSPVLEAWEKEQPKDFPNYTSGSWGPEAADKLLAQHKTHWRVL